MNTNSKVTESMDRELSVLRCLRAIRQEVKDHPERRQSLWARYSCLKSELAELDPTSPELGISIGGNPINAGLEDGS
jgi:hypothetical protein